METATVVRLAEVPNIVAVKEASGNLTQVMDVIFRQAPRYTTPWQVSLIVVLGHERCGAFRLGKAARPRSEVAETLLLVKRHRVVHLGADAAERELGTDAVAVTYFGDGAVNIGSTLETMNLAGAWSLPVCFFIENNRYAVSTTVEEATAEPRLSARGLGFNLASWKVDGQDPLAVHLAMSEAVAHLRVGLHGVGGADPLRLLVLRHGDVGAGELARAEHRQREHRGRAASLDEAAAKAMVCFWTSPEWSLKMAYAGSNPGNLNGFKTKWMKERLDTIKFLDVTTSMLPYGIPFPVIPESTEIMNIVMPEMLQNALTETMTVEESCNDAASKIEALMSGL